MTETDGVQALRRPSRPPSGAARSKRRDVLLEGLLQLCRLYNRPATAAELTAGLPLEDGHLTTSLLRRAAARANLDVRVGNADIRRIEPDLLPVLLIRDDGTVTALIRVDGEQCTIAMPEMESRHLTVETEVLAASLSGVVVFAAPLMQKDGRADGLAAEPSRHWFWGEVNRSWADFLEISFAAALANVLAVGSSMFAMQVYDRVVPNLAYATLWVLTVGVGLAIVIEAAIRLLRARLMDVAGRRLDLRISSRLFERALSIRLESRPKSTGSFVNQVREGDAVREFFTSTTIGALSDIPFVIFFVTIIAIIGGPVALVLVVAIPLIVVPGILAQWPLSALSREHLREGAVRNGLLMEAMFGAETVKATQAEGRFQRLWEEYSALLAGNGVRMRAISVMLTFSATAVQQLAYVMVMVVGVYRVGAGDMTVGALLACAILSSRTIAPLTQLAGIFARWQQMRAALVGLEGIMNAPVDRPADREFVHRPRLKGAYKLENVQFGYDEHNSAAIQIPSLTIEPGTAVALLGNNGSGKSTLLKLLAGLYEPNQGRLLIDQTDIRQIDPADVRNAVAYLPQDVRLFYGTLRDNLQMGIDSREDEELLEALSFVGAESLVQEHALGLDRMIGEGGSGVSGGQRQSIGLARIWLRDPPVLLLDEPTAAMDHALELRLIENLKRWSVGRTLVVATHRQPVLALAQRALVLNGGRPLADGSVKDVVAALASNQLQRPARHDAEG
ncbi:type I secretion system permease/ATPase [Ciceribacter sp. RN22]|uniref:type I secretion system permease/ATPase n=1 Tax=Ciceribacter sp. RN22 TaxID=2954932 RepID=UPI0020931542|nr:type I secretion system permease/ATPase [Ciceribacter sp. RN22]MCO6177490.1 type I secretion system permease/ATPase [Ciceribacter sp. RN22]